MRHGIGIGILPALLYSFLKVSGFSQIISCKVSEAVLYVFISVFTERVNALFNNLVIGLKPAEHPAVGVHGLLCGVHGHGRFGHTDTGRGSIGKMLYGIPCADRRAHHALSLMEVTGKVRIGIRYWSADVVPV